MPAVVKPRVVWFVEACYLDGRWHPIKVPDKKPFNRIAAQKEMMKLKEKYPQYKDRLRIMPYEQAPLRMSDDDE